MTPGPDKLSEVVWELLKELKNDVACLERKMLEGFQELRAISSKRDTQCALHDQRIVLVERDLETHLGEEEVHRGKWSDSLRGFLFATIGGVLVFTLQQIWVFLTTGKWGGR